MDLLIWLYTLDIDRDYNKPDMLLKTVMADHDFLVLVLSFFAKYPIVFLFKH